MSSAGSSARLYVCYEKGIGLMSDIAALLTLISVDENPWNERISIASIRGIVRSFHSLYAFA
jgi:hypothetical protein